MTSLKHNTNDLALEPGSLVLVTGASGFIANNIVYETLAAGYRVRGTVRSTEKGEITKKIFNSDKYEYVIVKEMDDPEAFHKVMKGVDGIIHVASVLTMSPDPNKVIVPTVVAATSIMEAALTEPTVKRFVYTSSSAAALLPRHGEKFYVDKNTWNHDVLKHVDAKPPFKEEDGFAVYAASKTKAEMAVWDFVKEKKPHYVVNCVLPNANFGRHWNENYSATGAWPVQTLKGNPPNFPGQYMIDVVDDARIHIAALIDKTLANERIFAFDETYNNFDLIQVVRKLRPEAKIPDGDPNEGRDLSEVDNALGAELLKKWWGQDGYKGLVQSIKENLEGY